MIFNSIEFLLFAALFFVLWPYLRKENNTRWTFITVASFVFYGWWDWRFLFLIVGSGLVDYICGAQIVKQPKNRRLFLGLSVFANLASLSVFKYSVFFASVIEDVFSVMNIQLDLVGSIPEFALILPVGISFYTFQSLSYTIDIYRGRLQPTNNILHFFSYLSMFPQLVAGPIVRAKDLLEQLNGYKVPNHLQQWNAIKLICFGLFQKVVLADNLAYFIDSAYEQKTAFDGPIFWWVVAIAFSFQIYCDFSGYSLMARGLAKYMGYHFKMNFNHPYLSNSLRQFWTRWHISLSTWFRDYIYIPLGGSRQGVLAASGALLFTMMVSGLWHGANYTFLAWAFVHVVFLLIERFTKWNKMFSPTSVLVTVIVFLQATFAWIYFRADNIHVAHGVMAKLFSFEGVNLNFIKFYFDNIIFLVLAIIIEAMILWRYRSTWVSSLYKKNNLDVVLVALAIVSIVFFRGEGKQFIYFQF